MPCSAAAAKVSKTHWQQNARQKIQALRCPRPAHHRTPARSLAAGSVARSASTISSIAATARSRRGQLETPGDHTANRDVFVNFLPPQRGSPHLESDFLEIFVRSVSQSTKPRRRESHDPPVVQFDEYMAALDPSPQGQHFLFSGCGGTHGRLQARPSVFKDKSLDFANVVRLHARNGCQRNRAQARTCTRHRARGRGCAGAQRPRPSRSENETSRLGARWACREPSQNVPPSTSCT